MKIHVWNISDLISYLIFKFCFKIVIPKLNSEKCLILNINMKKLTFNQILSK